MNGQLEFDGLKLTLQEHKEVMRKNNEVEAKKLELEEKKFRESQFRTRIAIGVGITLIVVILFALWYIRQYHVIYYFGQQLFPGQP